MLSEFFSFYTKASLKKFNVTTRSAPKRPPIAQINTAIQVIAILSPSKYLAKIRTKTPSTAFIARLVAFLKILYNTKAAIIARINNIISAGTIAINITP